MVADDGSKAGTTGVGEGRGGGRGCSLPTRREKKEKYIRVGESGEVEREGGRERDDVP